MQTQTQTTPGPWHENTKGANDYQSQVYAADGKTVAVTYTSNDADARLIAAAPAMHKAILQVFSAAEDGGDMEDIDWEGLRQSVSGL